MHRRPDAPFEVSLGPYSVQNAHNERSMIVLPLRMLRKLEDEQSLSGCVLSTLSVYEDLVSDNPVFFPEYTEHGRKHVQDVLRSAEGSREGRAHCV